MSIVLLTIMFHTRSVGRYDAVSLACFASATCASSSTRTCQAILQKAALKKEEIKSNFQLRSHWKPHSSVTTQAIQSSFHQHSFKVSRSKSLGQVSAVSLTNTPHTFSNAHVDYTMLLLQEENGNKICTINTSWQHQPPDQPRLASWCDVTGIVAWQHRQMNVNDVCHDSGSCSPHSHVTCHHE